MKIWGRARIETLPDAVVTVVIPTLSADRRLVECLDALAQQTRRDFEVMIVDNSGQGAGARGRSRAAGRERDRAAA